MSILKVDHERRPTFPIEQRSDFRSHYEIAAIRALQSIQRHWQLILSCVVLAIVLACLALPLMPRKYLATAFVSPNLYSPEQGKLVALASVDATAIVNGEARLIVSDGALQAVVRRLNPKQLSEREEEPRSDWLRNLFFPETRVESQMDRLVATLRSNVEVNKDSRSYLIAISFTASSPDEAVLVVNSVAIEYLLGKWIQRKSSAVSAAEAELARQLAVNGEKHPKVMQAVDALDAARADLKSFTSATEDGQALVGLDDGARFAVPNRTPTSPRGKVVLGLACLVGLLAGAGLALWRDRRGLEPLDLRSLFYRRRPDDGSSGQLQR
jgi:uncharacterized protein involved in exopolysaccharide biosynthesis